MPGPECADHVELRCSAIVLRRRTVLLVHRTGPADWVLPGGTPRRGESMAACARREVREETGLSADPTGVAFVLEASEPTSGLHTVDLVFVAAEHSSQAQPVPAEQGLVPWFVPLEELSDIDLRPPLAGHLRGLLTRRLPYAPYLGNLWRPPSGADGTRAPGMSAP